MGGGGKGGGGKKGGGGGLPPISIDLNGIIDLDTNNTLNATTNSNLNTSLAANTTSALTANTNSDLALTANTTSALNTNNALNAAVDIEPLQVDLCLKLGLDRLPSTGVCRDSSRRFRFSLFGVEVIGLSYDTDSKTVIEDLSQRPFVVGKRSEHNPSVGAQGIRIRIGD